MKCQLLKIKESPKMDFKILIIGLLEIREETYMET